MKEKITKKKKFVDQYAEEMKETKSYAKNVTESFLDFLRKMIIENGEVGFQKFGIFTVVEKPAHNAFNPKTREPVEVETKKVITFKPSKTFLKEINK